MREVADFLRANDVHFLLGLSVLSFVLLVCVFSLSRKLARISRRRNVRLEEGRLGDILDCLMDQSNALAGVQTQLSAIQTRQEEQGRALAGCVSNVGLVRFNAFDDVGGEQSFAVVLLDSDSNGVALSCIYGRQDSRVYAKAIYRGQGERPLSDEEQQALSEALEQGSTTSAARNVTAGRA